VSHDDTVSGTHATEIDDASQPESKTRMDPQIHFGRYKVKATLGQGEMGTVYLAEDPAIGRQVAIKTLRRPPGGVEPADDDARRRFDREIRVTGTFTHPNIVTVYDVGFEADEAFVAMAYIDGGSLDSLLAANQPLPFHRIIELASQIASGLDYAHERGVVHRDVKPSNILLTGDGLPLVSDFGVARMADSTLTRQGVTCGSPAYMSPEQAAAQEVTGASDQFSLAIIIYQMLTGETPFSGQSFVTVAYQILQHDPVPPELINPLVPKAAGEVLLRALSKLPSARYPSCTAFVDAFAEALDAPVENRGGARNSTRPAATLVVEVAPLEGPPNATADLGLPPLWAALTSGLARVSERLPSRKGLELLAGWTSLGSRFASANRRPLLMAASSIVVLATGMWLGAQLRGGDSTGETEPAERVTESALATVLPGILEQTPAASEPADAESEAAIPFLLMRPASASAPQETGTEPAEATGQETAAVVGQAVDEAPDPVAEARESVPTASDASEKPDPAPKAPEPVPADADPEPAEPEDPAVVALADGDVAAAETATPESRWTVVEAGTLPDKLVKRTVAATTVLDEIMSGPDQGIPSSLLDEAQCVAVIPSVKKVGFIFGARYGRGLVSCRTAGGWSRPSFVSITEGSFGFQIGARSSDFVLVFANQTAAARLLGDKFTLGADASVSAGPVGSTTETSADATPQTEIYAYSSSRGLFAGASLEGASLATDEDANEDVYGGDTGPQELLFNDRGRLPTELLTFVQALAALDAR